MASITPGGDSRAWLQSGQNTKRIFDEFSAQDDELDSAAEASGTGWGERARAASQAGCRATCIVWRTWEKMCSRVADRAVRGAASSSTSAAAR